MITQQKGKATYRVQNRPITRDSNFSILSTTSSSQLERVPPSSFQWYSRSLREEGWGWAWRQPGPKNRRYGPGPAQWRPGVAPAGDPAQPAEWTVAIIVYAARGRAQITPFYCYVDDDKFWYIFFTTRCASLFVVWGVGATFRCNKSAFPTFCYFILRGNVWSWI